MSADTKGPALTATNSPVAAPILNTKAASAPASASAGPSPSNTAAANAATPHNNSPTGNSSVAPAPVHNNSQAVNSATAPAPVHNSQGVNSAAAPAPVHNNSPTGNSSAATATAAAAKVNVEHVSNSRNNQTASHTISVAAEEGAESKGVFHSEPYSIGGFVEPPFIKPIHFSDIDQWKLPDRNYYVFICISFVLGFFGTDHFYLRSFGTGMQKLIFNIFSLGFWWWWDVIQIVTDSNKVQSEGLTTPFDWMRGIGRGVFEDPVKKAEALENGGKIVHVKKDLFIYALITLFFGIFGGDKFYLGETNQGIAKLLSVFNIFTFLFGLAWVIWDTVKVLFYTESLMKDGITVIPPFSMLFPDPIKAGPLFMPQELSKEQIDNEQGQEQASGGLPIVGMDTFRVLYKELAVPMLQPTVGTAIKTADKSVKMGQKAAAVGGEIMATAPKVAASVKGTMASALNPALIMEQVQEAAAKKAATRLGVQGGGGLISETAGSSGPIVAGTLLAVVLAGAGKFVYDIVNKQ